MSYKSPFQLAYYRFGLGNGSLCSYYTGVEKERWTELPQKFKTMFPICEGCSLHEKDMATKTHDGKMSNL